MCPNSCLLQNEMKKKCLLFGALRYSCLCCNETSMCLLSLSPNIMPQLILNLPPDIRSLIYALRRVIFCTSLLFSRVLQKIPIFLQLPRSSDYGEENIIALIFCKSSFKPFTAFMNNDDKSLYFGLGNIFTN